MSQIYLVNDRHRVPRFLVWYLFSAAISLSVFTALGIIAWIFLGDSQKNLLDFLPHIVTILFGIWGVYTGIGAVILWVAMWVYWVAWENSSFSARTGWFLALLFGMHYGALVYAIYLWNKGVIKNVTAPASADGAQ